MLFRTGISYVKNHYSVRNLLNQYKICSLALVSVG